MKLHLGCGKRYLPGWVNVDAQAIFPRKPDIVTDKLEKLPVESASCSEVMAIHLFEHLWRHKVNDYLQEWHRVLKPAGRLVLEMPDIYKSCKNLVAMVDNGKFPSGVEESEKVAREAWKYTLNPIYGYNPYKPPTSDGYWECHLWGWTYKTLKPVLEANGFKVLPEGRPQAHGGKENRDFRIEAVKL